MSCTIIVEVIVSPLVRAAERVGESRRRPLPAVDITNAIGSDSGLRGGWRHAKIHMLSVDARVDNVGIHSCPVSIENVSTVGPSRGIGGRGRQVAVYGVKAPRRTWLRRYLGL